jgi:IS5 family transposase
MRIVSDNQFRFDQVDISEIKFDESSRDELPRILKGLQHIYVTSDIREKVFKLLESAIPQNVSRKKGRKGMELWRILVLAVVRLGCNYNYDRLVDEANNHATLRKMLGHTDSQWDGGYKYKLQTVKDNLKLLTPELLAEISDIVVGAGHGMLSKKKRETLHASADTFPVHTNVDYPTDAKLLSDCLRTGAKISKKLADKFNIMGWRKMKYSLNQLQNMKNKIAREKKRNGNDKDEKVKAAYQGLLDQAYKIITRIESNIGTINNINTDIFVSVEIIILQDWIAEAFRQIDQIIRRVFKGEVIPHWEKIFSVFERHTKWIVKGKAGIFVELGVPVAILKDQHGFILNYQVMETEQDVDVCISLTELAKQKYPAIKSCSYDKGFWSKENYNSLTEIIENPVLPKKGKLNKEEKERESDKEFIRLRKQHPSVESAINGLNHSGLDRCPDSGIYGFKRYVGLGVLARNLQTLGNMILEKEAKRKRRKKTRKSA